MEEHTLDKLDQKILRLIANNARISFLEVARLCNVSGAAVHQRVQKMTNSGIITGSEFTLNMNKIGYETCAYIGLYFDKSDSLTLTNIITKLQEIPEIVECHATTGPYDLFVKIYAKNNSHLFDIVQNQIKPLGLSRSESIISYRESFRRQMLFNYGEDSETDLL